MEIRSTTADELSSGNEIRMSGARHIKKQDAVHKHMDMRPIGRKPATGTHGYLYGYFPPSFTASRPELTAMAGTGAEQMQFLNSLT